jgi:hypothetical protein
MHASSESRPLNQPRRKGTVAIDYFAKALSEIKNYNAGDVELEKSAFVEAYEPGAGRCGAELARLWEKAKRELQRDARSRANVDCSRSL